jgi:hypothetical protein
MNNKNIKKTELTWLVVGGAPRSGTTHMGCCLNQSKDISLFHEYISDRFFSVVNALFEETDRMKLLSDRNNLDDQAFLMNHLPDQEKHLKDIVQFVFKCVFNKKSRFIGTKFPGYQCWNQPDYPNWISPRYVHLTRNPFDAVLSLLIKDYKIEELKPSDVDDVLFYWISAWNHAVEHADDDNFFHIFYDELLVDSKSIEGRLSKFLDNVDDFNLSSFRATHSKPVYERFCDAKLEIYFPLISYIASEDNWTSFSAEKFNKRERIGFPYHWGREINLTLNSDGWRYVSGFYPPELDGSWTKGYLSEILFTPTTSCDGAIQISFEVSWVATFENRPVELNLILNDTNIYHCSMRTNLINGQCSTYSVYVPIFYLSSFNVVSLKFQTKNPINPYKLGLSDDDRDIAFMLRNVKFEKL